MEPSAQTFELMGRLCAGWSFLETRSEQVLWGILNIDENLGRVFTWPMGMRQKWTMIVREAKIRLTAGDHTFLNDINKDLVTAMRDRNIIIHGAIQMRAVIPSSFTRKDIIPPEIIANQQPLRAAAWTIYMGADAGKNFPVSTDAVKIVLENIQLLGNKLNDFNVDRGYVSTPEFKETVEKNWPKRLE